MPVCTKHPNVTVGYKEEDGCPVCRLEERVKELESQLKIAEKQIRELIIKIT